MRGVGVVSALAGQCETEGYATLFMNRTNRSGILKGGVIGGKNQSGSYKLDARFKKEVIASRLQRIAQYKDRISVYSEDALSLLKRCSEFLPQKSLVYLDPPYYVKGSGLYRNFYSHEDHLRIATSLQSESFKYSWVVSYDNVDEIRVMYEASKMIAYELHYSAQVRYQGDEVMFFSKNLHLPQLDPGFKQKAA